MYVCVCAFVGLEKQVRFGNFIAFYTDVLVTIVGMYVRIMSFMSLINYFEVLF